MRARYFPRCGSGTVGMAGHAVWLVAVGRQSPRRQPLRPAPPSHSRDRGAPLKVPIMLSEQQVWSSALAMVRRYGNEAAMQAGMRIEVFAHEDDREAQRAWL